MSNNNNFKNLRELFQQKYGIQPAIEVALQTNTERKSSLAKQQQVSKNPIFQQLQETNRSSSKNKQLQRSVNKNKDNVSPFTIKAKQVDMFTDRPRQQSFHQQSPLTLSQFQNFFQFQQLRSQLDTMKQQRQGSQEKRPLSGSKSHKSPRQQQLSQLVKVVQVSMQSQQQQQPSAYQQKSRVMSNHQSRNGSVQLDEREKSPISASSLQKFQSNGQITQINMQMSNCFENQDIKLEMPNKSQNNSNQHSRQPSNQFEVKQLQAQPQVKKHQQVDLIEKLIQNQKDQQIKQSKLRFKQDISIKSPSILQDQLKNINSQMQQHQQLEMMKQAQKQKIQQPEEDVTEEEDEVRIVDNYRGVIKSNFVFHYVIGKGGFGKVWKVELKKNRAVYAMKEMSKAKIISKRSVNSVMNEKTLLSQLQHHFLVNMTYAFQDRDNLYLIMDLLTGGDLRFHIGKMRRFKEQQTKFFVACIFLSLEYLHNNNVIHRDLKPENLVLDNKGYVRLTDLGIARVHKAENSADTSGTPGYMAPEVMCHQNHGIAVDYFALGVITYEFMIGRRPYQGRSRKEIRDQILAKQVQVKKHEIPDDWSLDAADFANRLIQRKPSNRLGFNGPEEVKNHPWLKNFPWQKLINKEIEAPYIPQTIDDNYEYLNQISDDNDSQDEIIQQNVVLLRKNSVQNLFAGYSYDSNAPTSNSNIGNNVTKLTKSTASTYSTAHNQNLEQKYFQSQS